MNYRMPSARPTPKKKAVLDGRDFRASGLWEKALEASRD